MFVGREEEENFKSKEKIGKYVFSRRKMINLSTVMKSVDTDTSESCKDLYVDPRPKFGKLRFFNFNYLYLTATFTDIDKIFSVYVTGVNVQNVLLKFSLHTQIALLSKFFLHIIR